MAGLTFLEDVLTLPDGRSYGASLDGWQREDFAAAFGANKHVWWERPRGHSKTMDGGAFALHHLLSGVGRRVFLGATDKDQAALAHDSLRGFIQRSELLQASLKVDRWKITARSTDSTLEVLDADAFTRFRDAGVFDRKVGEQFRQCILSQGDSKPPMELYKDFMGREPKLDPLLERQGLTRLS
ncbi:MAG: hypothetical protein IH876_10395 [Gemmatimonadetes bacterium]|nr:hypothetical protein [Gemmatimonadota bacterium]